MAWWRTLEAHQRAAIVTGAVLVAVSLTPLFALLWRYGDRVTDYRMIGIWAGPLVNRTAIAAILVTAAFWLRKR